MRGVQNQASHRLRTSKSTCPSRYQAEPGRWAPAASEILVWHEIGERWSMNKPERHSAGPRPNSGKRPRTAGSEGEQERERVREEIISRSQDPIRGQVHRPHDTIDKMIIAPKGQRNAFGGAGYHCMEKTTYMANPTATLRSTLEPYAVRPGRARGEGQGRVRIGRA